MSRETLLDDAITKAKEAEDWQLVEWLRMARGGESAARWYTERLREANRTIRKLMNENTKLRELAHLVADAEYTSVDQCEGCVAKRACNAGELDMCWIRKEILEKLRELGAVDAGELDG